MRRKLPITSLVAALTTVTALMVMKAVSAAARRGANCVVDVRGNQVCGTRAGQCVLDRYNAA